MPSSKNIRGITSSNKPTVRSVQRTYAPSTVQNLNQISDLWVDTANNRCFILADVTSGVATWTELMENSGNITTDALNEYTTGNGIIIDGIQIQDSSLKAFGNLQTNLILETTAGNGVYIDGITIKDGTANISDTLGVGGLFSITNTTASTSATTGSIVTAGGVGILGNLHIAGNTQMAVTTSAPSDAQLAASRLQFWANESATMPAFKMNSSASAITTGILNCTIVQGCWVRKNAQQGVPDSSSTTLTYDVELYNYNSLFTESGGTITCTIAGYYLVTFKVSYQALATGKDCLTDLAHSEDGRLVRDTRQNARAGDENQTVAVAFITHVPAAGWVKLVTYHNDGNTMNSPLSTGIGSANEIAVMLMVAD